MFKYVKSNTNFLFRKPQDMLLNFFVNNSGMLFNLCKLNFTQKNYFSDKNFREYQKVDNIIDKNFTNQTDSDSELHIHRHSTKPTMSHLKSHKRDEDVNKIIKKDVYREIPEHKNIKIEDIQNYHKEHSINISYDKMEKIPPPVLNFDQLNFTKDINDMIKSRFQTPTPIQAVGWPIALKGFNMVGLAETGSGKTLSYILPALMHIREQKYSHRSGPTVLIVAPTRELANQIHSVVEEYSNKFGIRSACLYGGVSKRDQIRDLSRGVDIVVATPGRLLDLLNMGKTNLHRTSFVILDEADRMLDMGFEPDLRKILGQVHTDSQTLMWSATWPVEIRKLANEFLKEYVHIKIGNQENGLSLNKRIQQKFKFCEEDNKFQSLFELLLHIHKESNEEGVTETTIDIKQKNEKNDTSNFQKTIIFTNYKSRCEVIVNDLKKKFQIDSIHGDKSQYERDQTIHKFKKGDTKILVATDVAARGLDISDVKVIINYDYPNSLDDYVHRIGRTGRSGKTGISYTLWSEENDQRAKPLVELLKKADQEIPKELIQRMHNRSRSKSSSRSKFYQNRRF
jgi:ATP-dependent RNA helicase DDX5/DBP2